MIINLKKRFLNSPILNSWLNHALKISLAIILLPVILVNFTAEEINVWFLLMTITSIGQGLIVGMNTTFVRFFSYSFAGVPIVDIDKIKSNFKATDHDENISQVADIYKVLLYLVSFFAILMLLLQITLGTLALYNPINQMSDPMVGWCSWIVVLCANTFNLFATVFQTYLNGANKVVLVQKTSTIIHIVGLLVLIMVIMSTLSLFNLILVYQLISVVISAALIYLSFQVNNNQLKSFTSAKFKTNVLKLIWSTAWKNSLTNLLSNITKHISAIIVAQLLPAAQSASFMLTKRVFEILDSFTMITFQAKVPQIARLRGKGDLPSVKRLLQKVLSICYGIFIIGYSIILFFGQDILLIIDSSTLLAGFNLLVLFSYSHLITRWAGLTMAVSNQANYVIDHIIVSIMSIIYFSLIYSLYEHLGVSAFPLSSLISVLVVMPFMIRKSYRNLNTSFIKFEKAKLMPAVIIVSIMNICYFAWYYYS